MFLDVGGAAEKESLINGKGSGCHYRGLLDVFMATLWQGFCSFWFMRAQRCLEGALALCN